MPEWLHDSFEKSGDFSVSLVALRLTVAFALGCVVAGIFRATHGKPNGQSAGLMATLVLLTVLIAMVMQVIGSNGATSVARAFSLAGALAIIRFRTMVEDTRDTAFVIFAVVVGMAVGVGFLTIPLVGIPIAAVAAFLFRPSKAEAASLEGPVDFTLKVRVGAGFRPDALLRETFGKHLERSRLKATATVRQGVALDLTYGVRLRREEEAVALVAELNGIEGVQEVELRQA